MSTIALIVSILIAYELLVGMTCIEKLIGDTRPPKKDALTIKGIYLLKKARKIFGESRREELKAERMPKRVKDIIIVTEKKYLQRRKQKEWRR